jgi:hypothetical protein
MRQEFVGVVEAGFRPPLVEGFTRFQAAPRISSQLDELLAKEIETGEAGPYDTHPSLKQRLAALSEFREGHAATPPTADEARAITLIDDVPRAEAAVVESMLKSGVPLPAPIEWEDVPSRVLTLGWLRVVEPSLPGLDGLTPVVFPEIALRLASDGDALVRQLGVPLGEDADIARAKAEGILGAALGLVLNEHRQRPSEIHLSAPPGEPVVFHIRTADTEILIEPFAVLDSLKTGALEPAAWLETCQTCGIANDDLGAYCRRASRARATMASREVLGQ